MLQLICLDLYLIITLFTRNNSTRNNSPTGGDSWSSGSNVISHDKYWVRVVYLRAVYNALCLFVVQPLRGVNFTFDRSKNSSFWKTNFHFWVWEVVLKILEFYQNWSFFHRVWRPCDEKTRVSAKLSFCKTRVFGGMWSYWTRLLSPVSFFSSFRFR